MALVAARDAAAAVGRRGRSCALDDALERLDPRQRQVVECRFFAGVDDEEIAQALGVTPRTVRRDWVKAGAWLNRWLRETPT